MDDELLQQFLAESRELVAAGGDDLLALERNPADRPRIDSAFRAFHTLKGAAGIIGFEPMATALHAAEDALAGVRGGAVLTRAVVDACLACLDQVGRWLDMIEVEGNPPAHAEGEAAAIVARFRPGQAARPAAAAPEASADWLAALLDRHRDVHGEALSAVSYRPDANCFFRGEDPLAAVLALPDVLRLDVLPLAPFPPLEALDPFRCAVELQVLSAARADELRSATATLSGVVAVVDVPDLIPLPRAAAAFIEAQLATLADHSSAGLGGRLAAAAKVAGNVLRRSGREADVAAVDAALAASLDGASPEPLIAVLAALLGSRVTTRVPDAAPDSPAAPVTDAGAAGPARSLRVDVDRIETLVNLTGELIVVKNAIGYSADLVLADPAAAALRLKDQHATLERIAAELREAVLGVRVRPFRSLFQRFPRLVRDLGVALGRTIELSMAGEDTEADKSVVEALFEPLLHLVRNAADHGIEPPEARRAGGKPEAGRIAISAARDGDDVVVEVTDDGAGMKVDRIRAVAHQRGIADAETLARMPDAGVLDLVFAPGFSTAAEVSDLSGRGVGMDAVRAAVERLGGRVGIASTPGTGTVVTLRLPVTVMVSRLMTVDVAGQPFGIPLEAVVETALVPRERISRIAGADAFVLRDRAVPLIDLRAALGTPAGAVPPLARVVVVSVAGSFGALEVDGLGDRMDAIVTPMSSLLDAAPGIAGTALLGDGRVLIVVDVEELLA